MRKISEGLYEYKGIEVKVNHNGCYVAMFNVNSTVGKCKVVGTTQSSFIRLFNQFVKNNGGLKK